jgi:hypothetical protein
LAPLTLQSLHHLYDQALWQMMKRKKTPQEEARAVVKKRMRGGRGERERTGAWPWKWNSRISCIYGRKAYAYI